MYQATVKAILEKRKQKQRPQDGRFPVVIRVTYRRETRKYAVGEFLSPDEWEALPSSRAEKWRNIREYVKEEVARAESVIKTLEPFTFESFKVRFKNRTNDGDSFLEFFANHIKGIQGEGGRDSTVITYTNALKALTGFKSSIAFREINTNLIASFKKHLLSEGKSLNTILAYLRAIRVALNTGKSHGLIETVPNIEELLPAPNPQKARVLEPGELQKIESERDRLLSDPVGQPEKVFALDIFLFSYYTGGMNLADIVSLKWDQLRGDQLQFIRKKIARTKNARSTSVQLTGEALSIIERQGRHQHSQYIFGLLDGKEDEFSVRRAINKAVNRNLKYVAKSLGLQHFSLYSARHTAATTLHRKGVPIAHIQRMLSHNNSATTEQYLAELDTDTQKRNYGMLRNEKE